MLRCSASGREAGQRAEPHAPGGGDPQGQDRGQQKQGHHAAPAHEEPHRVAVREDAHAGGSGQRPTRSTEPSRGDQPRGQARRFEPGRGRTAADDRGRAGDVGVDAAGRGHAHRAPDLGGRHAPARVDDVVHPCLAGPPAAHGRARGGQAALVQGDGLAGPSGRRWSSVTRTAQPPAGARPQTAMSPPRLTRVPAPVAPPIARAARSAASALAVAPRSRLTPGGSWARRRAGSRRTSRQRRPGPDGAGRRAGAAVDDEREVAVVAEVPHRGAQGGVDVAVRDVGGPQRDPERLDEQRAHLHRAPPRAVQPGQLGVLAEAAAGTVDLVQAPAQERHGRGERGGLLDRDQRRRPERGKAGRPPARLHPTSPRRRRREAG